MLLAALVVLAAAPLHSDAQLSSDRSAFNPPRQLSGAKKHAQLAPSHQHNLAPDDKSADTSKRAPSCNGCARRESVLSQTMRLDSFAAALSALGPRLAAAAALALALVGCLCVRSLSRELLLTAAYTALYFVASPTAILTNKILMKDVGFGYPILVSAVGQCVTSVCACAVERLGVGASVFGAAAAAPPPPDADGEGGASGRPRVDAWSLALLSGSSALALVLGQFPYFYLTVAFIQMLKAFSPTYMVLLLYCMGVEQPSRKVIGCVLGLSLCTAVASAGEVNFHIIGVSFMVAASLSDAVRLVVAQRVLKNHRLRPMETLSYMSPACLLWMVPFALLTEIPVALRNDSFRLLADHPLIFAASGCSGFFVNISSFLLVKRTSSMTLKTMTMARNGGLVLFSAAAMGEAVSPLEAAGYSGLLFFFALYACVKQQEAAAKPKVVVAPDEAERLCTESRSAQRG